MPKFNNWDQEKLSDQDILVDFTIQCDARFNNPGLCAEEYSRIIELVIKHFFNWDVQNQKSNGVGMFGELLAWCLATEEQGRKTLHGHFLLFIKDWIRILAVLQKQQDEQRLPDDERREDTVLKYDEAVRKTKHFYESVCSARLFADFEPGKVLRKQPIFDHNCVRENRK